jgi:hypothetical protein
MVAPTSWMVRTSVSGVNGPSPKYTEAPAHIGNTSSPPRPKVKASGGAADDDVVGRGRSTCRGQASQAASTSRWVCTAALGLPVVPEVKASSAMSSARWGRAAKSPSFAPTAPPASRARSGRLKGTMARSTGRLSQASRNSSSSLPSHSASHRLRLVDDVAQLARAQQRHGGHGHQPGLDDRQPGEGQPDRVAAAQQHAVAGHQAQVVDQHAGDAVDAVAHVGIGERDARRAQQRPVGPALLRRLVEQFLDQVQRSGRRRCGRS